MDDSGRVEQGDEPGREQWSNTKDVADMLNQIKGTFGKFDKNECSLYNNVRHGGSCRDIVYKYLNKQQQSMTWDQLK
jgi:hypothetical protein